MKFCRKGSRISISLHHSKVKDWDHFSVQLQPNKHWITQQVPFENFKQIGFGQQHVWSANALKGVDFLWRNQTGNKLVSLMNTVEI